jgi:hypothetical protein
MYIEVNHRVAPTATLARHMNPESLPPDRLGEISAALAAHDVVALRRLAASAASQEERDSLNLIADVMQRMSEQKLTQQRDQPKLPSRRAG